jgi:hypothetical protein
MDSERCAYLERCDLPGIPKTDRAKMGDLPVETKGVKKGILENRSPSIKKDGPSKKFKKQKDLRAYVKNRLKAGRAS